MKKVFFVIGILILPVIFIFLFSLRPNPNYSNYICVGEYYSELQNLQNMKYDEDFNTNKNVLIQRIENYKGQVDKWVICITGLIALAVSVISLIRDKCKKVMEAKEIAINDLDACKECDENTKKEFERDMKVIESSRKFDDAVKSFDKHTTPVLIIVYLYIIIQMINIMYFQEHLNYILLQIAKL